MFLVMPSRAEKMAHNGIRYLGTGVEYFINAKDAPLSSVIESNWAYPRTTPPTGTTYTVPAASAVTFDGTTWLTVNGTWPVGAKRWKVRGLSSDVHDTPITYTFTLGGVDWPFIIRTHVEDTLGEDVLFGGDSGVKMNGEDVIW